MAPAIPLTSGFSQTSDLNSSLFSILMLLSLLQTTNRVSGVLDSPSDAFIPIVKACASSRVWKVRMLAY